MDLSIFFIGLVFFLVAAAVVFGGYTYFRRNIEPGAESTDPDKFSQ